MFQKSSDMESAGRLCRLLLGYGSREKTRLSFSSNFGSIIVVQYGDVSLTSQKEKKSLNYISKRIQVEFIFRNQVAGARKTDLSGSSSENGIFRVNDEEYFSGTHIVLWHAVLGCAYVLVINPQESKTLGETNLSTLIKYMFSILNIPELDSKQQIMNNPEKISCILNVFLPSGQLLALNHRTLRLLQKELEKMLADKG